MMAIGRFQVLLLAAYVMSGILWAHPAVSQQVQPAADGPSRGDLAGFVATPQTDAGGNHAFLLAPNGAWFLATSPRASTARLIDINSGITLRYLTAPGLDIVALTISHDSTTVFARNYNGQIIAWDAATGQLVTRSPPTDFHDITRLSLRYEDSDEASRPTPEFLARYHLQSHFPDLKKNETITLNPTQEYAIIGYVGHRRWNAFQIWNLKKEQTELFFRLDEDTCGYPPISFDYDGKHLVFGNTQGESFSNHLDFAAFQIESFGTITTPIRETTQLLQHRCRFPPNFDFGIQPEFDISPNGQLLIKGPGMPSSPEWTAWDLRNGKKVASIRPGGDGTVSTDGSTFVVLHSEEEGYDAPANRLTVQRHGTRKTFKIPKSLQSNGLLVHVSQNGRWIALRLGETIAVWSANDGKVVKEYRLGRDHPAIMLQAADKGYPLLVDDKNGAAFVRGRWRTVRTTPHGLIVPLTPDFRAQCGAIFCDRVVADLGVVERQPRNDRARNVARVDLSPDGRFMMVRTLDEEDNVGHDVIDIADGHVVLHLKQDLSGTLTRSFAWNGRSLVVRDIGPNGNNSFVKYDLATGKRVWTATPYRAEDGFYTMFPDGRVRYSKGGSLDVVLVRGFEVKHFYGAAAKQFVASPDANE